MFSSGAGSVRNCCYQNVDVTFDEAAALLEYVDDWNKVEAQLPGIKQIPYHQRACVFLKDTACSVYEKRPASCRKYLVVGDPELCNSEVHPSGGVEVVGIHDAEILSSAAFNAVDAGPMAEMLLKVKRKFKK